MTYRNFSNKYPVMIIVQLLVVVLLMFISSQLRANEHEIFVLHSYSQEYQWTASQHEGFTAVYAAKEKNKSTIKTEYLDTKRKAFTKDYAKWFADYLKEKYQNYRPDIIYVTDDNALKFALVHFDSIFPNVPVIFSGINNYKILNRLYGKNFTGVFEQKEISPNLSLIELIDPNNNEVLIIGDQSNTAKSIEEETRKQLQKFSHIKANFISFSEIEPLMQALREHKGHYILLTTIGSIKDQTGKVLSLNETLEKIAHAGDHVIISMEDAYMGDGILGGYVTSGKKQGESAAAMVLRYLGDTPVKDIIPLIKSPNEYIFNYKELEKLNITLPDTIEDSAIILNKPETFYQRNRIAILFGFFILLLLLIALMAVFLIVLKHKNTEIQKNSGLLKKQAETLRQAKNSLTAYQKISSVGNWEWDTITGKNSWSDDVYQMLGLVPQSIEENLDNYLKYVPKEERNKISEAFNQALKSSMSGEIEHKIIQQDHTIKYAMLFICPQGKDDSGNIITITLLDITTFKKNELLEAEKFERIERYQDALIEWATIEHKNLDSAFEYATEISARTLNVPRVSIWLYKQNMSSIECKNIFIQEQGHSKGLELHRVDYPKYFAALKTAKSMCIDQARTDSRTSEFTKDYLIPNDIYSMLDAPIIYQGKVAGVVCHEQTNVVRHWSIQELEFATAIANTVSLSLEIDKRKQIEHQLVHQAYHDSLTGLPNRTLFTDRLEQALAHAKRNNTLLAVVFLDLDNFKEINDSFGHAVGDQVLVNVSRRIRDALRRVDTISRMGGDEFTIILPSFNDIEHINVVAEKLYAVLQESMFINENKFIVTGSIGISVYPNDGETVDLLLSNADDAMYQSKKGGRNCFHFYRKDLA